MNLNQWEDLEEKVCIECNGSVLDAGSLAEHAMKATRAIMDLVELCQHVEMNGQKLIPINSIVSLIDREMS
jgi:hypothetical protein